MKKTFSKKEAELLLQAQRERDAELVGKIKWPEGVTWSKNILGSDGWDFANSHLRDSHNKQVEETKQKILRSSLL